MKQTIWMFPGQGAQYYQMGRELFRNEPVFREFIENGDELARKLINQSLVDVLYRERSDRFDPFHRLLYTHPAILLFECAMAEMLVKRGLQPDYLLGQSLGEYACLVVSGVASFLDVLTAVIKQAELVEYCAPAGGMLAVLDSVEIVERYRHEFRDCTVAAHNFERNFLVSALPPVLGRLQAFLKSAGISTAELPVDYPFHSPAIDVLRCPFRQILEQLTFSMPRIPIISMERQDFWKDASAQRLWEVIRNQIDFIGTIRRLESSGPFLYVDLGPSGSMATATKYNLSKNSESEFMIVSSPFGHETDNLRALVRKCGGSL
jgi:acyl transferase domain-containing protein